MERDDGEWIRDQAASRAGPDDEWPAHDRPPGPPGPQPETGKRWDHGGVPGFSVWVAAAVAVLAAAAGVATALLIRGTPAASAAGPATPSTPPPGVTAPGGSGSSLPPLPGPAGNGKVQIILTGRVVAVSATSITIGGRGPSVTAAVTSATKITAAVHSIAGVKAGDDVAAQVSGTPGHLTAIAIQDPAR
jgi:hypothetical protein